MATMVLRCFEPRLSDSVQAKTDCAFRYCLVPPDLSGVLEKFSKGGDGLRRSLC